MSTFQELLEKMGLKGHKENTEALGFSERMKKMFHMKEKFAEMSKVTIHWQKCSMKWTSEEH